MPVTKRPVKVRTKRMEPKVKNRINEPVSMVEHKYLPREMLHPPRKHIHLDNIKHITKDYSVEPSDNIVECNGTFTVTLLSVAVLDIGKVYHIKNKGTGTITVDADDSETIDGETTQELYEEDNMMIYTNGEEWAII